MKKKSLSLSSQADNENSNLVEVSEVKGTPFRIVKEENKIMIIMGDHVVKDGFESEQDAKEYILHKPWELILTAGAIYNEYINKIRKEND